MKLFRIGEHFYNLDYLIKAEVRDDYVRLKFAAAGGDNLLTETITLENWKYMLDQIEPHCGSVSNDYKRPPKASIPPQKSTVQKRRY